MHSEPSRQAVIAIRNRAKAHVNYSMTDADAVGVALSAALTRDADEVTDVLLSGLQALKARSAKESLKITDAEFDVLFGNQSSAADSRVLQEYMQQSDFRAHEATIHAALRCSLEESGARSAWNRPCTRLACYYALHAESSEKKVSACLGGMVRADCRRLEEARFNVEDTGTDTLLLCRGILALAKSVV